MQDWEEAQAVHLEDSLTILPTIKQLAPTAATLLDVGSGAGLPGIVLAVTHPELQVCARLSSYYALSQACAMP